MKDFVIFIQIWMCVGMSIETYKTVRKLYGTVCVNFGMRAYLDTRYVLVPYFYVENHIEPYQLFCDF